MSLVLTDLYLRDFRSYNEITLSQLNSLTLFVGPNGVGKTNILEAIFILCTGSSFKGSTNIQLIKEGCNTSIIKANEEGDGRQLDLLITINKEGKTYSLNNKKKKASEIKGMLPSVVFTPDDLKLSKGSSSIRRNEIDVLGSQLSPHYRAVLKDYEKVIRYKNKLLKEEAAPPLLESINDTLLTCGTQLMYYRASLFMRLLPCIKDNYEDITPYGETFEARYTASWDYLQHKKDALCYPFGYPILEEFFDTTAQQFNREYLKKTFAENLSRWFDKEVECKRSLVGPHNDKITLFLSKRDVSVFASQGQMRSIALAWKLSEVALLEQSLGQQPVLLLDDVMSELDKNRRSLLVDLVRRDIQTFITTTDLEGLPHDIVEKANVIHLSYTE